MKELRTNGDKRNTKGDKRDTKETKGTRRETRGTRRETKRDNDGTRVKSRWNKIRSCTRIYNPIPLVAVCEEIIKNPHVCVLQWRHFACPRSIWISPILSLFRWIVGCNSVQNLDHNGPLQMGTHLSEEHVHQTSPGKTQTNLTNEHVIEVASNAKRQCFNEDSHLLQKSVEGCHGRCCTKAMFIVIIFIFITHNFATFWQKTFKLNTFIMCCKACNHKMSETRLQKYEFSTIEHVQKFGGKEISVHVLLGILDRSTSI